MLQVLLPVLTVVFLFVETGVHTAFWEDALKKQPCAMRLALYFGMLLFPIGALCLPRFSLFLFLCAYLLTCVFQEWISPLPLGRLGDSASMRFVLVGSIQLSVLGLSALVTANGLQGIFTSISNQQIAICVGLGSFVAAKAIQYFFGKKMEIVVLNKQQKDFRYMYYFLYTNIAYILIQSVLCHFYWLLENGTAFLLASNLISVVLMVCYVNSLIEIFNTEAAESFNSALNLSLEQVDVRLRQLRASAHYDGLTGAYSRLYILQQANQMLSQQTFFSLVYIDVNGLKEVNDNHGHQAGDDYLRFFVQFMQHQIRANDMMARFGGDEFILLLLDCTEENARKRIDTIRKKIQNENLPFLFAAGVSDSSQADQLEKMIRLADERMYKEKQEGRNAPNG